MNNATNALRRYLPAALTALTIFTSSLAFGYAGELPRYLGFHISANGARLLMLIDGDTGYSVTPPTPNEWSINPRLPMDR